MPRTVLSMRSRTILWTLAALLGIVAAAAIAWSASKLAGQHIGLAAESLPAQGLAPAHPSAGRRARVAPRHQAPRRKSSGHRNPPSSATASVTQQTATVSASAAGVLPTVSSGAGSPLPVQPSSGTPTAAAPPAKAATTTGSFSSNPSSGSSGSGSSGGGQHEDRGGSSGSSGSGGGGRDD